MCWPHWCRVPKVLNKAIFATVRDRPRDEYHKHVAAAVAAVQDKEAVDGPTATHICIASGCQKRVRPDNPFCKDHEI
jgi:hypothetical protein